MKRIERHRLKENEFAATLAHARDVMDRRRRDIAAGAILIVVLLAIMGGYAWWRYARNAKANGSLATALATYSAPVVPPAAPAPGSAPPVPQPGTFQTERAKNEAALPKFVETANAYPNTDAGITARYHAASILASLGRYAEAEQRYTEVMDKAGSGIYSRTARLGLADVQIAQGKYDSAISVLTELSRDTNSQLPVDSVLMHLGRAYARAGKKEEAVRAFTRIIDEFPQSLYAADARKEIADVKKS